MEAFPLEKSQVSMHLPRGRAVLYLVQYMFLYKYSSMRCWKTLNNMLQQKIIFNDVLWHTEMTSKMSESDS